MMTAKCPYVCPLPFLPNGVSQKNFIETKEFPIGETISSILLLHPCVRVQVTSFPHYFLDKKSVEIVTAMSKWTSLAS
jgi:hypothetical protein